MSDSHNKSPLTLEELIRLKRAERPCPEFWARFEHDLRQKQLTALLERRPWWQQLLNVPGRRKVFFPLGATAIVAFAVVSVRLYVPMQTARVEPVDSNQNNFAAKATASMVAVVASEQPEPVVAPITVPESRSDHEVAMMAAAPLSEHLPEHAVELTPWSAPLPAQSLSTKLVVPAVDYLERDDLRSPQPLISNPMPIATSRLQRSGGAVAELASVSALASKRTRLLAQFSDRQFAPEPQAPANIRERLTRHLSDTSFSEHFNRIGLKGDQVSLRF